MVISQAYFFWRLHSCKLSLKKTTPQLQVSCKLGLEVKMKHTQHGYLISLLFLAFTFLQIFFKKTTPQLQVSCKLGLEVKMRHTQHGYLISLLFLAFTFLQIVFKKNYSTASSVHPSISVQQLEISEQIFTKF